MKLKPVERLELGRGVRLCYQFGCSHSITLEAKHQRISKQICLQTCFHVLCEMGLTSMGLGVNFLKEEISS